MKKSVILDIFMGNRGHNESIIMPDDWKKNTDKDNDVYDELKEKLSPELFKLLYKYTEGLEDSYCGQIDFYFVEGFKLGLRVGIECMDE